MKINLFQVKTLFTVCLKLSQSKSILPHFNSIVYSCYSCVRLRRGLFLAHLSTKCSWWAIVISLCPLSVVRALSTFCFKRLLLQNRTSPPKQQDGFWNNFTGRFLGWPSIKIAQTVLLHWTRWPPELKIEKHLNDFSWTRGWILK